MASGFHVLRLKLHIGINDDVGGNCPIDNMGRSPCLGSPRMGFNHFRAPATFSITQNLGFNCSIIRIERCISPKPPLGVYRLP